jgi:hypothetical protein
MNAADGSMSEDRSVQPECAAMPVAAAHAYAARGWSVIVIQPRGKRPLVPWREFQQRIASTAEIDGWFQRWPDANVGVVTGRLSGLVVVDVDPRHGGPASIAALEAEQGPLPATVEALTGGGGRHLYFAHPGATVANRVAVRAGIDVRGDGGCVVAPPSVHPSGRRYAWVAGREPQRCPLAPAPRHLIGATGPGRGHPPSHWRRLVRETLVPGRRNDTIASMTGHLLRRGVDLDVVLELMLAWNRSHCRPPLPDAEVARVVRSIERLHAEREAADAEDGK